MVTLSLAAHVGAFVAATDVESGALLAIVLAAGSRGEHRVSVLDTRDYALVASFPIPSRARSGVTPVHGDGDLLFASDDHTIVAFEPRTGRRIWERSFPAPAVSRVAGVSRGRVLVSIETGDYRPKTQLLRARDGGDEGTFPVSIIESLSVPALGPAGELVLVSMRTVDVFRAGCEKRRIDLATPRYGSIDLAELDEAGARLLIGTRAGDVVLMDLAAGTAVAILAMDDAVRAVGFMRGVPWAMDTAGRLRLLGEGEHRTSVDLGLSTGGGFLGDDGETIGVSDFETRTFRVRRVPSNEEIFATTPGFRCSAVAIDADGSILVSGDERLIRIDASTGKIAKAGAPADHVARLGDGTLMLIGDSIRALPPGAAKAVALSKLNDQFTVTDDKTLVASSNQVVEVWDIASAKRTSRIDLATTWVGETGEALDLAYIGPDGELWMFLSDGNVLRGASLEPIHKLTTKGALHLHPDGRRLFRVRGRMVTCLALPSFEERELFALPIDADVTTLQFSPTGRRLVVFHRNGRLSSIDLASGERVAVASPDTAAAERAPGELYLVDLQTPSTCAFGRDEMHIAWPHAGGIAFANATTGALAGQLLIATSGRDYVVSDGQSFEWPGARSRKPISSEIEASDGTSEIDLPSLLSRRDAALLAKLTR